MIVAVFAVYCQNTYIEIGIGGFGDRTRIRSKKSSSML